MYSVQHVLWRGAMAISLLVVGGIGAGMSPQPLPAVEDQIACEDAAFVFDGVHGEMKSGFAFVVDQPVQHLQVFETVVIKGIPPQPEEA
ncbi:hypothetical protein LF41_1501 [Lysobacter dokdonensis DS-58]|uniref:Uncharacterized protein n=1 Tax=Lysobacter dokdonensis DS-58 TaxID=1300345 RepID=A0A0A2WHG5_9GAMM|nr:hypothetical protein [Lysobacter dokdonensis]KGQ18147.1 hypothetical protein LF41_1501 [Lysobacter dokdonensis DS-58]